MKKPNVTMTSALAQMLSGDANQVQRTFPQREAQRDMLEQVVRHVTTTRDHRFQHGDPVHYFACTGPFNSAAQKGLALAFWRYLLPGDLEDDHRIKNANDTEFISFPFIDCMIVAFDGNMVKFMLGCSGLLKAGDPEVSQQEHSIDR